MLKRIFISALSASMLMGALTGCEGIPVKDKNKLSVVCTIFPEYDWTKEILGVQAENAQLTYLLDKGSDLHNFQPTAQDMITISECDLFIYVGGESDGWVEDALKSAKNKDMEVINLMEVLGDSAKVEELKEGMQEDEHEHEHEDEHEDEEEHEHEHEEGEEEYDEHVWLSLKNAKVFCGEICDSLCKLDEKNADAYKKNLSDYSQKLDTLDSDFQTLIDESDTQTLIFGDRFPFRYFADDYGLDYYAAFVGCSAETEASFETITFLANKIDELKADTIFVIENSDHSIADGIIQNTKSKNQTIAELNSMQSVTSDMVKNGTTYLGLMQKNYDTLKEALN